MTQLSRNGIRSGENSTRKHFRRMNIKPTIKTSQVQTEPSCHVVLGPDSKPLFYCASLAAAKATGLPFVSVPHQMNIK